MTKGRSDWTNVSLIKAVDDEGKLVSVLVDDLGAIIAVMQGDYEGTLKTLKVDNEGYLQARLMGLHAGTLETVKLDSHGKIETLDQYATINIASKTITGAESGATYYSDAVPTGRKWRVHVFMTQHSAANAVIPELGIFKAEVFDAVYLKDGGTGRKLMWEGSPKPMSAGWKLFVNYDTGDTGTLYLQYLYEEETV